MSGVAGADRIKSRNDFKQFLASYQKLIAKFPGFVSMNTSGSYNSDLNKNDFGDIDLIIHLKSDKDKAAVKKELQAFLQAQPDTVIVPFTSEKHAGKRSYNAGELVSIRYHDDTLGYSAQIDNIIAMDETEATFKQQFLDLPAEKQGLILGLVKIATIETDPQKLFKSLGIGAPALDDPNAEYEFNLSSVELQLRKVTYKPGTYEQIGREVIWTSRNFDDLKKVLYQYNLDATFDELLAHSKQTIKNPRSNARMQGVFGSMITVKSGEVGTAKGAGKEAALDKIKRTFSESRLLREMIKPQANTIVFAFGRFQPPTIGHELLINTVKNTAAGKSADYVIYASKTQDHKANPLTINQKMHYLDLMFPGTNFAAANAEVRTFIEAAKLLNKRYKNLIMVAGSDRVEAFQTTLNQYNGKEYNYDTINVVSAGDRDPDSDSIAGMSGTRMREAAVAGDIKLFMSGLPKTISADDAEQLMKDIQQGLVKQPKTTMKAKEIEPVAESAADDINKMFGNMYDPVVTKLQRIALLAMQGRQQEAAGHLDRVIQDASPSAQKTIVNAVNNIKPVTINGKPADSSTLDKSSAHQEWILKTFIPWVQSQLNKKDVAEGNEVSDAAQARELIGRAVRNSQERNNYFDFIKHLIKKNGKDYGVRVHQLAAKLAKDSNGVEESRGHKIIATKLRNMDNMKNVQVPTPQEQKAAKAAKEKQTSEAYPKQQAARYNPDGDTYKGSGNKMPTLDPNDPVHAADRYGIEHDEPYEQDFEKSELKDLIAKHLERLSKRQQIVLKLRFWHDLSLEDVGKHLGISPVRVRQIEAKALRSLRTPTSKSDELRPYAEAKQRLDPKCWKGYKKQGTKMKGNTRVNNCVPVGESAEATMSKLIKLLESK